MKYFWVAVIQLPFAAVLLTPGCAISILSNASRRAASSSAAAAVERNCSCECCVAELERDESQDVADSPSLMQCVYATSSASSAASSCGSTCQRSADDGILDAAELDTQRFCFMECEPVASPSRLSGAAAPGDPCGPLSRADAAVVESAKGAAPLPPNELPGVLNHFLVARQPPLASAATPSGDVSTVPAAALPSAAPWSSVGAAALAQSAQIAAWAQEARKDADLAAVAVVGVGEAVKSASTSLAAAAGAALDAKRAAEEAIAGEHRVRDIRNALQRRAREAALNTVPVAVDALRQEARAMAKANALSLKSARERQMKSLAPVAAYQASLPYESARQSAMASEQRSLAEGDRLAQLAAQMQSAAHQAEDSANQLLAAGAEEDATKLMAEARGEMEKANEISVKASNLYATARSISESLPAYDQRAQDAAYRAAVLVDPDTPQPSAPLVLSQQPRSASGQRPPVGGRRV